LKTTLLTAFFLFFFFLPFAYSQSYYAQPSKGIADHHIRDAKRARPSGIDTLPVLLDYYIADTTSRFGHYTSLQGQLINKYYSYYSIPSDTTNSYLGKSMFYMNYDCINSIAVAFDSVYDANYNIGYPPYAVSSLAIDTIFIPIIQVNNSNHADTLQLQLTAVDINGYPTSSYLLDTLVVDTNIGGKGNDTLIKTIKWKLDDYPLSDYRFAVTVTYYDYTKHDSCWFIYGYGYFTKSCPYEGANTLFANPTNFSKIAGSPKPLIANSFAAWNEYTGYGLFPTESGNNVFYPCYAADTSHFHPGTDGANYIQNIDIYADVELATAAGINKLNSAKLFIGQNYPNPFTNSSTITYNISQSSNLTFSVSDLAGREILHQDYGTMPPGQHSITINATTFSPGIYFYSITANGSTVTKKMVVY
jgi:Secretion system C-terminal sorting domain